MINSDTFPAAVVTHEGEVLEAVCDDFHMTLGPVMIYRGFTGTEVSLTPALAQEHAWK